MATEHKWERVDKTFREFLYGKDHDLDTSECQPGILLEVRSPEGEVTRELVGDINKLGGLCDDCSISPSAIVLAKLDLRSVVERPARTLALVAAIEAWGRTPASEGAVDDLWDAARAFINGSEPPIPARVKLEDVS